MDLLIRCSSLGKIMGTPKKPKDGFDLTQTAKTYIESLVVENVYGIKSKIFSKYLQKGIECEDDSIDLYNEVFFTSFDKNEIRLSNEYIQGECDIDTGDMIIDIKSSWDIDTFPKLPENINNKDYEWQLRGYMWLYRRDMARLAYCLVDTPDDLLGYSDYPEKHQVSHIEPELRITFVDFYRDESKEDLIKQKVIECRRYAEYYKQRLLDKNR